MKTHLLFLIISVSINLSAQDKISPELAKFIKSHGSYTLLSDSSKFNPAFVNALPLIRNYFNFAKENWKAYFTVPEDITYSKISGGSEFMIVPIFHLQFFQLWFDGQKEMDKRNKSEKRHPESDTNPWLTYYPMPTGKDGHIQINLNEKEVMFFPLQK